MEQRFVRPKTIAMQLAERELAERGIGDDIEAFLRTRYVDEGKDLSEIGAELERDTSTISRWLAHFGIPTRTVGRRRTEAVA